MGRLGALRASQVVMGLAGIAMLASSAEFGVYSGYTLPLLPAGVTALATSILLARTTVRRSILLVFPALALFGNTISSLFIPPQGTLYGPYHVAIVTLASVLAVYSALTSPSSGKARIGLTLLLAFTAYLGVYVAHNIIEPLVPLLLVAGILGLTGVEDYSVPSASVAIIAPMALSQNTASMGFYLLGGAPAWVEAARTRGMPLTGLALLHTVPVLAGLFPEYYLLVYTAAIIAFSMAVLDSRILLAPLTIAAIASMYQAASDPVHRVMVFTGVFAALTSIMVFSNYVGGIRARANGVAAGAAGLVITLSLLAPATALPVAAGACEPMLQGLGYVVSNETATYSRVYDQARDLVSDAEALFQGLKPADRIMLLLLLDSPVPARILGPGEISSVTIVDFATSENFTVNASEGFLVLPLDNTVEAYYAIDDSGEPPLLRVAIRLPSIGLPYDILGGVEPSPVHTAIQVEFAAPLIIRLPYNTSLIVYEAVIGSSFILGERTTEVEETPIGILWTNAVLGVTRGIVTGPASTLEVPYPIGIDLLDAAREVIGLGEAASQDYIALKAVAPLIGRQGPATIPEWIATGSKGVIGPLELTALTPEPARGTTPYPAYNGIDACIAFVRPGEARYEDLRAPYDVVIILREAYRSGGSPETIYSLALDLADHNASSAAQALWLAVHWDVIAGGEAPVPIVEGVEGAYLTLSLLAPFVAVPVPFLWALARRTGESAELATGAEPELAED